MMTKLIAWCIDNRFLVMILTVIVAVVGIWATVTIPVDAIPDLSDVQVIIYTPWQGRDPQTVEDQVTYPLTQTMLAVPGVQDVRGYSFFGFSFVYVIFEDGTDMYWARSRVLEYMNQAQGQLPEDATPRLGPDASGLGWVYIYTLEDTKNKHNLGELRALQDWYVKYQLQSVPGVAEVATVGGAVRQYQVTVNPQKLLYHRIALKDVVAAIKDSNNDVGGRVVEFSETEHMVRGRGYITNKKDLEQIVLQATEDGTPVLLGDVAVVQIGPDIKRGIAEKNGQGEVVAGIVVMRYGENALKTIENVKRKIEELEPGLPDGVVIRSAYDRSGLIQRSVDTLKVTLTEELAITAIICLIFLLHIRSGLVAAAVLPLGILASFIVMKLAGVNANIMSISGIAVAIGTMVDSSIVMVENLHKQKEQNPGAPHWELVKSSAQEVGPGLFSALLVITVSFLPVFALQGQAGRMFKPLAITKTLAMAAAAIIAVTVIPPLMGLFVRGKTPTEQKNPVNRLSIGLYLPFIRFAMRHKLVSIAVAVLLLAVSLVPLLSLSRGMLGATPGVGPVLQTGVDDALDVPLVKKLQIGSEFMPPLREGDILYMPTSVPGISITEARRTLQIQDQLLAQFPEVKVVLGKIGRADTPTDPAPLSMVETHISLRPEEHWPKRLIANGYLQLIAAEMIAELQSEGFLSPGEDTWKPADVAELAGNDARFEINKQTRLELVAAVNADMKKLRTALEKHRKEAKERGESVASRFSEEKLEEQWAADLLQRHMDRIRPTIPTRIVEQLPRNLIDTLLSHGAINQQRKDAAIAHVQQRWKGRISVADVPLKRTTFEELTKEEMHKAVTIPGMPNWWLMPIETRIGMLTTGMRGLLGLKLYGTDLKRLEELGIKLETILKEVPGTVSVAAERAMGGHYLDITVNRKECARHGLKVGDVQRLIETAVGGMNIDTTVEGRYRFPINVRYPSELRDDPEKIRRILVATPKGKLIPLGQVAKVEFVDGPPVVKSEAGMLLVNIPVDIESGVDIGSYVQQAQAAIDRAIAEDRLKIPAGYHLKWSGQYEFMEQVLDRLTIIIPITLAIIFILIYFSMKNVTETLITMFTLPFALIGGIWGMYLLGYNMSVAVAIGFIALAGLAAETGIIMHVYLDSAYKKHRAEKGRPLTAEELYNAVIDGAVQRVRPKLMTVLTDFIALMPILWATTPGAGPMKRIAVPVIFGVITSAVHTLVLIPVYYTLYKRWEQWGEQRRESRAELADEPR